MRFEARELKPYGEPVSPENLKVGEVYFAFFVFDREGKIPTLLPRVFIGSNLEPSDEDKLYFQDFESYKHGIRYETSTSDDEAIFETGAEKHIYDYEKALELLMGCSLRRRQAP
jgi:hypothetical protein